MKLPFWGTVLTIVGVAILCSLGFWQFARLQWKQELISTINAEYGVDSAAVHLSAKDIMQPVLFKRGQIFGQYHHDKEIRISSRVHESIPGYHIVTPFSLDGGAIILVNRGWIPIEEERNDDFLVRRPTGHVTLLGGLREPQGTSSFVPHNNPENDVWYRIDIQQIETVRGVSNVSPNVFYVEALIQAQTPSLGKYPIVQQSRLTLNNNHAQYTFFWFTMAVMMCVVYVFRFIVPQYRKSDEV